MIRIEIDADGPAQLRSIAKFFEQQAAAKEADRQYEIDVNKKLRDAQTAIEVLVARDRAAAAAEQEPELPAPAKRGRKPDTPEERAAKKAARDAAKNTPAGADPASPAGGESDNTGSAAPVSFPAGEPASAAAVGSAGHSVPAAASITEAQMREALNALIEAIGGDPGMVAASAIVKKYGYVRVREIKAEHFAAIAADAAAMLPKAAS